MEKVVNIIAKALLIIIFAIGIISTVMILVNSSNENVSKVMDFAIPFSWVIMILTIVSSVLFSLFNIFSEKKKAIKSGLVLALMGILVLVSFALSSNEIVGRVIQGFYDNGDITIGIVRLVDMGLILSYIIAALTVLVFVYTGVASLFKR